MEFRDYLRMLRRGWPVVALVTMVAVAAAGAYVTLVPRTYQASSVIYVSVQGAQSVGDLQQGAEYAETAAKTYSSIASSPTVLGPVIRDLRLPTTTAALAASVDVSVRPSTPLIEVTASAPTARQSADLANTVVKETIAEVQRLESETSMLGLRYVQLRQVQPADVPLIAVSPNVRRTLALGLLVGLIVGISGAVLMQSLDTRVRGPRALWTLTRAPLLASIPRIRRSQADTLLMRDNPVGRVGEAFRTLRTNLRSLEPTGRRSLLIAPVAETRGGVDVTANLAWTLAEVGYRVVLVDADLRSARVSTLLGTGRHAGLSDVLAGGATLDEALLGSGHPLLTVLPAGALSPKPSELLGSLELATILATLEASFDYVVVDGPAVLASSDATVLAVNVERTLVTVTSGRTQAAQVSAALGRLENAGQAVAGIVLTQVGRGPARDEFLKPPDNRASAARAGATEPTLADASVRVS